MENETISKTRIPQQMDASGSALDRLLSRPNKYFDDTAHIKQRG